MFELNCIFILFITVSELYFSFCFYFTGEECAITRGIWFYDGSWIPVDTECSNILENVHLELFFGKKLSDYITEPCNKTPKAGKKNIFFPF